MTAICPVLPSPSERGPSAPLLTMGTACQVSGRLRPPQAVCDTAAARSPSIRDHRRTLNALPALRL